MKALCLWQTSLPFLDSGSILTPDRKMFIGILFGVILAYMIQIFYCWRVSIGEYDEL